MEKENKDLLKSRVEVLRDALKDVQDTIRAQDRKASYIIAIEFFIIIGFFYSYKYMSNVENLEHFKINDYTHLFDLFPILFFLISIGYLFLSYSPVSNPQEVLNKEDQEFGKSKFFIFYFKDLGYNSEKLVEDYLNTARDEKGLIRILYIEILKLSKIRERKIKYIKEANEWLFIAFLFSLFQIVTFFSYTNVFIGIGVLSVLLYKVCK